MRLDVFEALAPCCPRCLHTDGRVSPIIVADTIDTRGDHLWHGVLHCSDRACWMEFPVIDGIPILLADPRTFIANSQAQVLRRDMLPEALTGILADSIGPGSEFDTTRQHLSLYAGAQFSDWMDEGRDSGLAAALHAGIALQEQTPSGPAIDIGGSVGRSGWELNAIGAGPTVVADLNFSMLQLGQRLALEGTATFDRRQVGVVFERCTISVPDELAAHAPDFWAVDATAMPFVDAQFQTACAMNVVDCVSAPVAVMAEMARVMTESGTAILCTPYDWSPAATDLEQWLGGHSQRGPFNGRSEDVLTQTLAQLGLPVVGESHDQTWRLQTHARAVMEYQLHLVACRRAAPASAL